VAWGDVSALISPEVWDLSKIVTPPTSVVSDLIEREVQKLAEFVSALPYIEGREWQVQFGTAQENIESGDIRLPVKIYSRSVDPTAVEVVD